MKREDIIRMAWEAGFWVDEFARAVEKNCISPTYHRIDDQLERFAELVAAAEREACAKVCDALHYEVDAYGAQCAAAIRARGQA